MNAKQALQFLFIGKHHEYNIHKYILDTKTYVDPKNAEPKTLHDRVTKPHTIVAGVVVLSVNSNV